MSWNSQKTDLEAKFLNLENLLKVTVQSNDLFCQKWSFAVSLTKANFTLNIQKRSF